VELNKRIFMDIELILTKEGRFITTSKDQDQTSEYICLEMSLLDFLNSNENFIIGEESQIKFTRKDDKSIVATFPGETSDMLKNKISQLLAENQVGKDCQ
jgi:hypothetical protein